MLFFCLLNRKKLILILGINLTCFVCGLYLGVGGYGGYANCAGSIHQKRPGGFRGRVGILCKNASRGQIQTRVAPKCACKILWGGDCRTPDLRMTPLKGIYVASSSFPIPASNSTCSPPSRKEALLTTDSPVISSKCLLS